MAHMEDSNNHVLEFCWGKKRGVGGTKKDIQFYESFMIDGVNYSLFDCVYLYKMGELEPYIGKIVKIWEQPDHRKKVKVLWFFRPNELQNYLGDHAPPEKEIFLASGEGVGLFNINPLEAVAGKCSVICTSKDKRNPQPSEEEVEMADYIFHRTFDVQTLRISEALEDKIAGIEAKYLLNRKDLKPSSVSELEAKVVDGNDKVASRIPIPSTVSNSELLSALDIDKHGALPSSTGRNNAIEDKHLQEGASFLDEKAYPLSPNDFVKDKKGVTGVAEDHVENTMQSAKTKSCPSVFGDKPSKKMRLTSDSMKPLHDLQNGPTPTKPKFESDGDGSSKDTLQFQKESLQKMNLSEKKPKPSDETLQNETPIKVENDKKPDHQILEVTRRPDADRSKWFKGLPWEGRIQKADEQGTLVFIENLDPSYTSSEVEDIAYHAVKQSCTARVIQQATFQHPKYGQAYVIFKTKEAADLAVSRINMGCLMLSNGSPLICSKGLLKVPKSSMTGHLSIDKIKLQMREDMKRAVSTSHCSQPNTIEYEMAMDWFLMQQRFVGSFNRMHKDHSDAEKQVKRSFKMK